MQVQNNAGKLKDSQQLGFPFPALRWNGKPVHSPSFHSYLEKIFLNHHFWSIKTL